MAPPPLVINVIDTLGTVLVQVSGELDLQTVPELAAVLARLRSRQCELDLAPVPFADSTALNALLRHRLDALADGGSLRVVAISPPVQRLLEITGTTGLLTADPNSEQPGTTLA